VVKNNLGGQYKQKYELTLIALMLYFLMGILSLVFSRGFDVDSFGFRLMGILAVGVGANWVSKNVKINWGKGGDEKDSQ
jgi:hypothetical protein